VAGSEVGCRAPRVAILGRLSWAFRMFWLGAMLGSVATLQEWSDKLGRYGPRALSRDVEALLAERGI
jgi:hypothetical protein